MADTTAPRPLGALGPALLGAAVLGIALVGYLVAPQLDDQMFVAAAATVTVIVALGSWLLVAGGPRRFAPSRLFGATAWVAPSGWYLATLVAGRLLAIDDLWVASLLAAMMLGVVLLAQHRELLEQGPGQRLAEFLVNLAVFVSAFTMFAVVSELRLGGLAHALLCGLISTVFAAVPLRRALVGGAQTIVHAGLAGAIVGQLAWAVSFWRLPSLVAAAAMLLALYVVVGLCEAILDRSFGRRIVVEYGVVGLCGVALIVGVGPWRA